MRTALRTLALAGVVLASDVRAGDARVRPGETLAGPRAEQGGQAAPGGGAEPLTPSTLAARSGGVLIVLGVLGGTFLALRRRRRAADGGALPLEVVARTALSPKHSIVVLEVAGQRLVVGISGDRMTALAATSLAATSLAAAPLSATPLAAAPLSATPLETDVLRLSAGSAESSPRPGPTPLEAETIRSDRRDRLARDDNDERDRLPGETALSRRLRDRRGNHPRPLEPLFSRDDDLDERETLRPEELAPYRRSVDCVKSFLSEEEEGPSPADEGRGREERRRGGDWV